MTFTFNPLAPRGARLPSARADTALRRFQSTSSSRSQTSSDKRTFPAQSNFNPLAPRGARRYMAGRLPSLLRYFNPLAPRGARLPSARADTALRRFQSTSSSRSQTSSDKRTFPAQSNFNPLAPRGARRYMAGRLPSLLRYFNPLAPRGARRFCLVGNPV